jgi:hypothetical protein
MPVAVDSAPLVPAESPTAGAVDAPAAGRSTRRGITFEQLALGALFLVLFGRAAHAPAQNDTWWHLRAGQDIWRGLMPTVERWTFTARGHAWPDHEWLSEALFYAVHRVGGMALLTAMVAAVVTATYALIWRLMPGPVLRRAALVFATLPATLIIASLRPQVFSLLLLVMTVTVIVRERFLFLPFVFLVWANLHGAVVIGGVVVGVALVVALVWERRCVRTLAIATALSALAALVTPLGPRIVGLVFGMSSEGDIAEWVPAWHTMPAGAVLGAVAAVALLAFLAIRRARALQWADRVLAGCSIALLPLAVRYSRLIPMFVVVALPLIAAGWEAWRPARPRVADRSRVHTALLVVTAIAVVAWVGAAWIGSDPALGWEPISPAAARAVRSCPGPVYEQFADGGDVAWFAPAVPVFVDSRVDPYPHRFLGREIAAEATGEYRATFARWGIRCAFVEPVSATAHQLLADGWTTSYADPNWLLLVPAGDTR